MIELYTDATPNGHKVSIMLEEIGMKYEVRHVDIWTGAQKEDWFLKLSPNGRIPAIVDKDNSNLAIFESGAILLYLAEKSGKLIPQPEHGRSNVIQWLMFQMSAIGPMMGQANVQSVDEPDLLSGNLVGRFQRLLHLESQYHISERRSEEQPRHLK